MKMEVADYVHALRGSGLTQAQISQGTGIAQSTISKIETGSVNDVMSKSFVALQTLHKKHCKTAKVRKASVPLTPSATKHDTAPGAVVANNQPNTMEVA